MNQLLRLFPLAGVLFLCLSGSAQHFTSTNMAATAIGQLMAQHGGGSAPEVLGYDTIAKLTVADNSTVELVKSMTITDTLLLGSASILQLSTFNLHLAPGAKVVGASNKSYIRTNSTGSLERNLQASDGEVLFPIGLTHYNPAYITNDGTADDFSVRVENTVYEDGTTGSAVTTDVVQCTWHIDEATAGGSDVTLRLQWHTDNEGTDFDRTKCGIAHYMGSSWQDPPSMPKAQDETNGFYSASRSGITSFSPFAVEDGEVTLPVVLSYFEAERIENEAVNLSWTTHSELNNRGFEVQRKTTFGTIETVGWVDGQGTTSNITHYDFTDYTSTEAYYRLRQMDADGNESLSAWKAVAPAREAATGLAAWPNPTRGQLTIQLPDGAEYALFNTMGQRVQQGRLHSLQTSISLEACPPGSYILRAFNGSSWQSITVVKQGS